MDYTLIEVPNMNDSYSRFVVNGKAFLLRFTYNDTGDYWKFGVYTLKYEPIVVGLKIVPMLSLNVFRSLTDMPSGAFVALTRLNRIGRNDFAEGNARFVFCPVTIEE